MRRVKLLWMTMVIVVAVFSVRTENTPGFLVSVKAQDGNAESGPLSTTQWLLEEHQPIVLSIQDVLGAPLPAASLFNPDNRSYDWASIDWPAMLQVGDMAVVGGKEVTLLDYSIVAGKDNPTAYSPSSQSLHDEFDGISRFGSWSEIFIPPGSTLIMLQVQVFPEERGDVCDDRRVVRYLVSYRDYAAAEALTLYGGNLGDYGAANISCLTSGWLYFYVATLDPIDLHDLWFYSASYNNDLAIWSLGE